MTTTPDPTTPALLSAARPIGYMGAAEIDALQARCGEYGLPAREACRVLASHAALLAHLDALTAPAVPDGGEALGRMLNEIRSRLIRRALDGYPGRAGVEEEMAKIDVESALALYQRGHAAACARAANILADRDATIARLQGEVAGAARLAAVLSAHWPDDLPAVEERSPVTVADVAGRVLLRMQEEQERLTAELAGAHDRAIVFGRNVVASTERAMQAQIDALAAELAEARAATARAKAACEKTEGAMHLADREEDKRVAAARRDGAREEREAIRDKVDHDARFGADSARGPMLAIVDWLDSRARGEGQGP